MKRSFLVLGVVALVEIAVLIQVGRWLGLWPTLGIVVATGLLGVAEVRRAGIDAVSRLQGAMERREDPGEPIFHAAMSLLAGALLISPGLVADTVGVLLLLPPVRQALYRKVRGRRRDVTVTYRVIEERDIEPRH